MILREPDWDTHATTEPGIHMWTQDLLEWAPQQDAPWSPGLQQAAEVPLGGTTVFISNSGPSDQVKFQTQEQNQKSTLKEFLEDPSHQWALLRQFNYRRSKASGYSFVEKNPTHKDTASQIQKACTSSLSYYFYMIWYPKDLCSWSKMDNQQSLLIMLKG